MKYTSTNLEEYGFDDELAATEEPFEASFTRLMDISRVISADEEQVMFRDIVVAYIGTHPHKDTPS